MKANTKEAIRKSNDAKAAYDDVATVEPREGEHLRILRAFHHWQGLRTCALELVSQEFAPELK